MSNIFREAKDLLDKKDAGGELSWEELRLIATAEIPFLVSRCPSLKDMAVRGLLGDAGTNRRR